MPCSILGGIGKLNKGTSDTHHIYELLWVIGFDIGQKRLPTPPAIIMICISLKLCIILLFYLLVSLKEIFFRKPTRPSLPLKKFFLPLRLSCKESSTFLTKPLFPQEREDVAGCAIASARVLVSSAEPVP